MRLWPRRLLTLKSRLQKGSWTWWINLRPHQMGKIQTEALKVRVERYLYYLLLSQK